MIYERGNAYDCGKARKSVAVTVTSNHTNAVPPNISIRDKTYPVYVIFGEKVNVLIKMVLTKSPECAPGISIRDKTARRDTSAHGTQGKIHL